MKCGRKETTTALTAAAKSYLLHKGFSCYEELLVNKQSGVRADVIAVNLRRRVIICEVKSSVADYASDKKWHAYLSCCDQFYFVFTEDTFERLKERLKTDLAGTKAGVLVLNRATGYLGSKRGAKAEDMEARVRRYLIARMAWRGGHSARNHRRTRVFINAETSAQETTQ